MVSCAGTTKTTDATGRFSFIGVPRGSVDIAVEADTYRPQQRTVVLEEFLTQNFNLVPLDTMTTFSGHVRHRVGDSAIHYALVTLGDAHTLTDRDGFFELTDRPHGHQTVTISHHQHNTHDFSVIFYLDEYEEDFYLTKNDSVTVPITVDTYVHTIHPDSLDSTFCNRQRVYIDGANDDGADLDRIGYLQTPESLLPAEYPWAQFVSGVLQVGMAGAWDHHVCGMNHTVEFSIWEIGASWWECLVTGNEAPATGSIMYTYAEDTALSLIKNAPQWLSVEVTDELASAQNFGFAFVPHAASCNLFFIVSSENMEQTSYHPYLKVIYAY